MKLMNRFYFTYFYFYFYFSKEGKTGFCMIKSK